MITPVPSEDSRTLLSFERNTTTRTTTLHPEKPATSQHRSETPPEKHASSVHSQPALASKDEDSCTIVKMIGHCLTSKTFHQPGQFLDIKSLPPSSSDESQQHQRNVPFTPAVPARKKESCTVAKTVGHCEDARFHSPLRSLLHFLALDR